MLGDGTVTNPFGSGDEPVGLGKYVTACAATTAGLININIDTQV
jgi:hypothetical protein